MRVLFMCDTLGGGGAQKLVTDLILTMKDEDEIQMVVLSSNSDKYSQILKKSGVNVKFIDAKRPLEILSRLKKIFINEEFDVIHVNLFHSLYYASILKRILGKKCPPLTMTEHSTDNKRRHKSWMKPIEKWIYGSYEYIISISQETQNQLISWLDPVKKEKFCVIENGIQLSKFTNAKAISRETLCSQYSENDVLIAMVGSFTLQKNHETMIKAMKKLPSHYKLILVGEGPLCEKIKGMVAELNLKNRVYFFGFRKDVAEIMHSVDILAIPSLWEGFGLIAVEGMASGVPLVSSDVIGLSDIVSDCGLKFKPEREDEIANCIAQLSNPNIYNELKRKGMKRAQLFDIAEMKTRYKYVLKKAVK